MFNAPRKFLLPACCEGSYKVVNFPLSQLELPLNLGDTVASLQKNPEITTIIEATYNQLSLELERNS